MQRYSTLSSLTWSARVLYLRALVLLALAEIALSGTFTASCSAAVQRQFTQAVEACPLAILTQVSSCAPSGPDFKTAAAECTPGCKCAESSVGKTGEPYTVFGMHQYCNAQFKISVVLGSMFIEPFVDCNRITYCPFCVAERCRYKCADISSHSCAAQLLASVAQLDAPDATRETAAAGEVSPACRASAGDKRPAERTSSPEKAVSVDVAASVEDASSEKASSEKESFEKASSDKASSDEASSNKASSNKASSEKEEPKRGSLGFEEIIAIVSGIVGVIGVVVAVITLHYQRMGMGSASSENQ